MRMMLALSLLGGAGLLHAQVPMSLAESQFTGSFGPDSSAVNGQLVTVSGIALSSSSHFYSGSNSSFYMIDPSGEDYGATLVFKSGGNDWFDIAVGDSIRVTGVIQEYRTNEGAIFSNMTEIVPGVPDTDVEILAYGANLPDPVDVDMYLLDPVRHDTHVAEHLESRLVRIQGSVVVDISAPPSWRQFTVADAEGNETVIRTAAYNLSNYGRPPLGSSFDLILGVVYQVFGNYNVMPRDLDDLILSVGPPVISGATLGPCGATPADALEFSTNITDDTGVDEAFVFYRVNEGAWIEYGLVRDPESPARFAVTLPAQPEGSMLDYYVMALDDQGEESMWPAGGPSADTFPQFFVTGTTANGCQAVQSGMYDNGASMYQCHEATITGTVTFGYTDFGADTSATFRNYIIACDEGPWNSIHVYNNNSHGVWIEQLERGDRVTLTGEITEYNGLTELSYLSAFEFVSGGNTVDPAAHSIDDLLASAESYESVLVQLSDLTVTNASLGFGEIEVSDGTGTLRVGSDGVWNIDFENGDTIDQLTGVFTYAFNTWRISPRDNDDFTGLVDLAEGSPRLDFTLKGNYPNPFNPSTEIEYSLVRPGITSLDIYNIRGERVTRLFEGEQAAGSHRITWNAEAMASGIYFARLTVDGAGSRDARMLLIK
jgi:DNA/RNA endonuclease YhcR with UshA esterase domain